MLQRLRAFTLIELALVLVIVSLMTGFGLQAFETTTSVNCSANTQDQLKTIDRALQNFAAANSRFPKPAMVNQGSNNPQFGYEAADGPDGGTAPDDSSAAGYATMVPAGMTQSGDVLIGALPHATLGLSSDYASDCWGSKFSYAVTNSQTSSEVNIGYPSGAVGTIKLRTGTLSSSEEISPVITYVVVSHGEDKYGATPMSAGDPTAITCNGSTANKIDRENCNSDATFYSAMVNTGGTNNYFDDLMVYSSKIQSQEDCPNQTISWGPGSCSGPTGVLTHGQNNIPVTSTASGYWVGTTYARCQDGTLTQVGSPTCSQQQPCTPAARSWGSGNCSGTPSGDISHGGTAVVNNASSGYMGNATFSCTNGALSVAGSPVPTCNPNTCSGAQSWGPGNACTGSVSNIAHGSTPSVSNTNSGFSGTATFTCNAGVLGISGSPSCVSTTNPCAAAQAVSWGAGCTATTGAGMTHLGTQAVSHSGASYTGSGTATCNNGVVSATGSCFAHCNSGGSVVWNTNCSAVRPSITHGNSTMVSNAASGFTGTASISCTNGSYSAPSSTTCNPEAPLVTGALYCWGKNDDGEIGDNSTTARDVPTAATNPSGVTGWVTATSAGTHSCGIAQNREAYCWGKNDFGQFGNNTMFVNSLVPTIVTKPGGVTGWKQITTGDLSHTCAIANTSQAYCWGRNDNGELGDGTTTLRTLPIPVLNPSGVGFWKQLATGTYLTCGIGSNDQAYCWGRNGSGQIGDGTTTPRSSPTQITNPSGVTGWNRITAGFSNACGIGNNGQAYCWGSNTYGETGDNTSGTNRLVPTLVVNPSGVTSWTHIASGDLAHNCGVGNNGQAYCWGANFYGQIGDNTTTTRLVPTQATNPSGVTSWKNITAGNGHSCGTGNNSGVYCWGIGIYSQIGHGATSSPRVPTSVTNPSGVSGWLGVSTYNQQSCAVVDPSIVPGTCGTATSTSTLTAPSSNLCASGTPSTVQDFGAGAQWMWTCSGTSCNSPRSCAGGQTISWGAGWACSITSTQQNHAAYLDNTPNTAPGYTGQADVQCSHGAWSTVNATCTAAAACASGWGPEQVYSMEGDMGACMAYTYTIGNCTSGQGGTTPSDTGNVDTCISRISGSGACTVYSRECGGSTGTCGSAHGTNNNTSAPSSGLCASGSPSAVTGSGPYSWTCSGTACSANRACTAMNPMAWSSNCQANQSAQNHGYSGSLSNSAAGYTGSLTMSCSQGSWTPSSPTCTASGGGNCTGHSGTFDEGRCTNTGAVIATWTSQNGISWSGPYNPIGMSINDRAAACFNNGGTCYDANYTSWGEHQTGNYNRRTEERCYGGGSTSYVSGISYWNDDGLVEDINDWTVTLKTPAQCPAPVPGECPSSPDMYNQTCNVGRPRQTGVGCFAGAERAEWYCDGYHGGASSSLCWGSGYPCAS